MPEIVTSVCKIYPVDTQGSWTLSKIAEDHLKVLSSSLAPEEDKNQLR